MMRQPYIIWYAIITHAVWGILLLFQSSAQGATAINSIVKITGSTIAAASLFILVSALAFFALFKDRKHDMTSLALCIPQQMLLIWTALGCWNAIKTSSFADGVVRPWAFIAADQLPGILVMIMHTVAMIDWHWQPKRLTNELQ